MSRGSLFELAAASTAEAVQVEDQEYPSLPMEQGPTLTSAQPSRVTPGWWQAAQRRAYRFFCR